MSVRIASIRPLSGQVWVAPQVHTDDLGELREAGYAWLVNHRPDGEEPDQPTAAEIESAAAEAGIRVVHAPARGLPDAAVVAATRAVLDEMGPDDKAVFFCRSGMRSAAAWAMAERQAGAEPEALRRAAAEAGYDLSGLPL